MIDFNKLYKAGVKAMVLGEQIYDLFSGLPLTGYIGKVYERCEDDGTLIIFETWIENGERAWRTVFEHQRNYRKVTP